MKFPDVIIDPRTQRVVVTSTGTAEATVIPAEVLNLRNLKGDLLDRVAAAVDLAIKGFAIDIVQDAWLANPYRLLQQRRQAGYTWTPSLLKNAVPFIIPGIAEPNMVSYDADHPPLGAILVAPPGHAVGDPGVLIPPVPEPVHPPVSPIGVPAGGSRYMVNPLAGDETPDGGMYVELGITYRKVIVPAFAGINAKWWERQP